MHILIDWFELCYPCLSLFLSLAPSISSFFSPTHISIWFINGMCACVFVCLCMRVVFRAEFLYEWKSNHIFCRSMAWSKIHELYNAIALLCRIRCMIKIGFTNLIVPSTGFWQNLRQKVVSIDFCCRSKFPTCKINEKLLWPISHMWTFIASLNNFIDFSRLAAATKGIRFKRTLQILFGSKSIFMSYI